MRHYRSITVLLGFLCTFVAYAQEDPVIILDEVILSDARLQQFSEGVKVRTISDSVLRRSNPLLTEVLRYNSAIYFRENGYGMVSSASFRGTGAQQTAVIWNGININSQLNGQTDFNTVIPQAYDNIVVRSGGGSSQYGSGAVGGSIHLNNTLDFNPKQHHEVFLGYGSFDTRTLRYNTRHGNEKFAIDIGASYLSSDNDYKYLGTDRRNENGAFEHLNFNLTTGYRIADNHLLKLYHNTFFGDRNFSGTLTAPSNDNYKDINSRSLLEWVSFKNQKTARLRLAHLYERFRYFPNRDTDDFSFGTSGNTLLNYDYKYKLKNITLNGIGEASAIQARGTSIRNTTRTLFSGTFLATHAVTEKFTYGINLRKEIVSDYDSPVVYGVNAAYTFGSRYTLNVNGSRNFRIPTFNDLYWNGLGAVGNLAIIPETALQAEIGHAYKGKGYGLHFTSYYIASDNLIQWRPDLSGIWSPINVNKVAQYGLEAEAKLQKRWGEHQLLWNTGYAYTRAVNTETNTQLSYVPKSKITSSIAYQYKKWSWFYQFLANGSVYTTTDESASLPAYALSNTGFSYALDMRSGGRYDIGVRVHNLFNTNYQNVAFRPMPNRAINFQITSKF